MLRGAVAIACAASTSLAAPCPLLPPRVYPQSGTAVAPNVQIALFLRPELKADTRVLDAWKPAITDGAATVPLRRVKGVRWSPKGERVSLFQATKPLPPGGWRLAGLDTLSKFAAPLANARWAVTVSPPDTLAPRLVVRGVDRSRCAAVSEPDRVCSIALDADPPAEPLLIEANLKTAGAAAVYVDFQPAGGPLLLRNDACDSPFSALRPGPAALSVRFLDGAGNASNAYAARLDLRDVNDEVQHPEPAREDHDHADH